MAWQVEFEEKAAAELATPDRPIARRITKFLRERVAPPDDPRSIGEALHGSKLGEFWKYRVGDWRLICSIGHRGAVYGRKSQVLRLER